MGDHGGGVFSRRDPYRPARWPAGVSAAAAPRPACPGRSRPAACGHRTAAPAVSAIGEVAIALQLIPRLLAGAGPRRSSLTLAKNNRGPAERPLRPARPASSRTSAPWLRRALMCGAEGEIVPQHGAGQAGAIDDGFGFDPGHRAEHVSDRAAGHRNQDRLGAGTSPLSAAMRVTLPGHRLSRYFTRPACAGKEAGMRS